MKSLLELTRQSSKKFFSFVVSFGFACLAAGAVAQTPADPYNYSRKSNFEYFPAGSALAGLLKIERVEPDNPQLCVETEYTYDTNNGNRTGATTRNCTNASGSGAIGFAVFELRSSGSAFASYTVSIGGTPVSVPAGTFPTQATNALSQSETRTVDPRFGALLSLTGPNNLTTSYALDDWGRVTEELRADGTKTRTQYCLIGGRATDTSSNSADCGSTGALSGRSDEIPAAAFSYVQVQNFVGTTVAGPAQRTYKDNEGRAIREVVEAFDGNTNTANRIIVKDTVYNAYGVATVVSGTYFLDSGSANISGTNDRSLTRTTVDALGRPTTVEQTTFANDTRGTAVTMNSLSGSYAGTVRVITTSVAYSGLNTTTTNPLGQTRVEEKNVGGLLVRVTDAQGAQIAYQHDAFGNLRITKDALQNLVQLSYDYRGRKLTMDDPDTGSWSYAYNALGELRNQQSPNQRNAGQSTATAYDKLGRMVQRVEPEFTSNWTYDSCDKGVGKLCSTSTTHGVAKAFTYDSLGRPSTSRVAVTSGPSFNTKLTYDTNGRVQTQTYPTGLQVAYSYTSKGFLNKTVLAQAMNIVPDTAPGQAPGPTVSWPAGKILWGAGSLNARGQSESQTLGDGVAAVTSRASFDGPTGRVTDLNAGIGGGNAALAYTYTWDSIGNLAARSDNNGDGNTGTISDTYTYDALNRLVQYTVKATASGALTRTVDLHYNAIGNLLYKSDVGNYAYRDYGNTGAYTRPQPHALQSLSRTDGSTITYTYDANGNAVTANGGAWRSINYTSFNLPDSNQGAQNGNGLKYTWFYDENHQRLKEVRTNAQGTRTTWNVHPDNQGGLGFETESTGAGTNLNRHYIAAGASTLVIVTREALSAYASSAATAPRDLTNVTITAVKVEFWHKDHLGSTVATTDHNGVVTARYAYDPFGKRRQTNGTYDSFGTLVVDWVDGSNKGTDRGWTGHEHLDDIGIVHMNGRLFDPLTGRFLQGDPLIQDSDNLQNYNRYSYCYNNPLICSDPSGYFSLRKFLGAAAVGAVIDIFAPGVGTLLTVLYNGRMVARTTIGYQIGSIVISIASAVVCQEAAAACNGIGQAIWARAGGFSAAQSLRTGAFAALSTYVNGQIGNAFNGYGDFRGFSATSLAQNTFAHGVWGCAEGKLQGGSCGAGLRAGLAGAAISNYANINTRNFALDTMIHAVGGGVASVAGGGSFWQGAKSAAFAYLFNELAHATSCVQRGYCSKVYDDGTVCPAGKACYNPLESGGPAQQISGGQVAGGILAAGAFVLLPELAIPRALLASDLGLVGTVTQLDGTIALVGTELRLTVDMVAGRFAAMTFPQVTASLNALAVSVGATTINIQATLANPVLARALQMNGWTVTAGTVAPYADSITKVVK